MSKPQSNALYMFVLALGSFVWVSFVGIKGDNSLLIKETAVALRVPALCNQVSPWRLTLFKSLQSRCIEEASSETETPATMIYANKYQLDSTRLMDQAKSGELDHFWLEKGIKFNPSLASYYQPPVLKDGYDAAYESVVDYPTGDCDRFFWGYKKARCWTRRAVLEETSFEARKTLCQKIESSDARFQCNSTIYELGDADVIKILKERGRF